MAVFERSTVVPCSAAALFRYHAAPGAFGRLSPPFEDATIVVPLPRLENGARAEFDVGVGPLSLRWIARHEDVVAGGDSGDSGDNGDNGGHNDDDNDTVRGFVDVMESGPFSSWRHEHRFEPLPVHDGQPRCRLVDRITYQGPLLGSGDLFVERKLSSMFAHRHRTTVLDAALLSSLPMPVSPHGRRLKVGVTGASGLIGSEVRALLSVAGCDLVAFIRPGSTPSSKTPPGQGSVSWDPHSGALGAGASGLDAVIHLAGENVGEGRLDDDKKRRVRQQRVEQTTRLLDALARQAAPPRVLVAASAVGVYGDRGDDVVDEDSPPPSGPAANFFSELCQAWEAAVLDHAGPPQGSWRAVALRIGIVQSPRGGALRKLKPVFQMGGGGVLGDGSSWTPPIAIDDVSAIVWRALVDERLRGAVNAVGPAPVTQQDYARTLAHVLRRPALVPVPRFALQLALGEFGDRILDSQRVVPTRLTSLGHTFRHASLEDALRHVLGR